MTDRVRCPGCLGWNTDQQYPDFLVCRSCTLISQRNRVTTARYDAEYVATRYEKYSTTESMSRLRATLVETVLTLHDSLPRGLCVPERGRLLDVGYGNGSFIREMYSRGWGAYGNDVNPTPYKGVTQVPLPMEDGARYKAITFFDALEHFEELQEVRKVASFTDWIFLSFPTVPLDFPDKATQWKHYRPGEHHFHFNTQSVLSLFSGGGNKAHLVYSGHPEDHIRGKREGAWPNITTLGLRIAHK